MLPFSKRKRSDEIELEDADIVVLEEAAVEVDVADLEIADTAKADALADERPQLPRVSPPPKSSLRHLLTSAGSHTRRDRFEDDVADECLKSIAAATSRTGLSDSFPASIVPPAPRLPNFESSIDELLAEAPLPQFEISDTDETTRRPALSSSSSMPAIPFSRDSVPGVLPIPAAPLSVSAIPTPVFSRTTSSPHLPAASSIAPVAMSSAPGPVEPTLILLRQPPKAAWVAAAAFLGAACALLGMHLLTRSVDPPQTVVVTAPPPPTQATLAAPAPPPATVRFNDDQGMAVIAAPPATVSAAPAATAPKPVVTTAAVKPAAKAASLGPKLPDGSMALTTKAPSSPPPAAQPAPQPQPAPAAPAAAAQKKQLTPEQQLAEAQLRASMR